MSRKRQKLQHNKHIQNKKKFFDKLPQDHFSKAPIWDHKIDLYKDLSSNDKDDNIKIAQEGQEWHHIMNFLTGCCVAVGALIVFGELINQAEAIEQYVDNVLGNNNVHIDEA